MDDSWHFCLKSQLSYHKSCIYWSLSTTNIRNCLQKCGFRRADLLFQLFQFPYLHLGIDLRKYELNKCFEASSLTCGHLFSFKPCLIYFNRGNFLLAFNIGVSMPILWFPKKGDKVLTPVGNKEFTRKALVAPQSEHRHAPQHNLSLLSSSPTSLPDSAVPHKPTVSCSKLIGPHNPGPRLSSASNIAPSYEFLHPQISTF